MFPSETVDARMRMFNADGSEGEVSGNALRCVAKYLYESGRVPKTEMDLETGGGVKHLSLYLQDGQVYSVCVSMGHPRFEPNVIPVNLKGKEIIDRDVTIGGQAYRISCVSMGNPHCVIFVDDVEAVDLEKVGPMIENCDLFPRRANVSFACVRDPYTIRMRVWERGIGETMACGTGACAVVATAVKKGLCPFGQEISVRLPGGELVIRWDENGIFKTGDAVKDFEGVIEV